MNKSTEWNYCTSKFVRKKCLIKHDETMRIVWIFGPSDIVVTATLSLVAGAHARTHRHKRCGWPWRVISYSTPCARCLACPWIQNKAPAPSQYPVKYPYPLQTIHCPSSSSSFSLSFCVFFVDIIYKRFYLLIIMAG